MKSVEAMLYSKTGAKKALDMVAQERALKIDIVYGPAHNRSTHQLATTMRTPGHDEHLAIGLLFSLGIIDGADDVEEIVPARARAWRVERTTAWSFTSLTTDPMRPIIFLFGHARYSSCGVCGSRDLPPSGDVKNDGLVIISARLLKNLSEKIAHHQHGFKETGGLHAAALFDQQGEMLAIFEDVGRHNALDKLIGKVLLEDLTLFSKSILLITSRASFEMVQKAHMAKIPVIAAMGAVSSYAIEVAEMSFITLIGFLRPDRFNAYTHQSRIHESE